MDKELFVIKVNRKYAAEGLLPLDVRDLPELASFGGIGGEFTERDVDHPLIKDFLKKKQEKVHKLQSERACQLCAQGFVPAHSLERYLYCELRVPPPEGYCPTCLGKILEQLDSRNENLRCCG